MKTIIEYLRVSLISIEFAFVCVLAFAGTFYPAVFIFVGKALASQVEALKWIPAISTALCAAAAGLAWKLTVPKEENDFELLEWPGYWRLKMRRDYSMLLSSVVAGCSALIWIFASSIDTFWMGMLTIACLGVGLINLGCMFVAALTLREVVGFRGKGRF